MQHNQSMSQIDNLLINNARALGDKRPDFIERRRELVLAEALNMLSKEGYQRYIDELQADIMKAIDNSMASLGNEREKAHKFINTISSLNTEQKSGYHRNIDRCTTEHEINGVTLQAGWDHICINDTMPTGNGKYLQQ